MKKKDFLDKVSIDLPQGSKKVTAVVIEYIDNKGISNRKTVKLNKTLRGNNPIIIGHKQIYPKLISSNNIENVYNCKTIDA